ncbi:MAG: class I lanthipeptide [Candidatus Aminicenantes bacterium]|nr:class I lanthipeptide [Candidatus Aminicenantes bacterium]
MKQTFSKKLVLNKTTVSDLNSKQMNAVRGGMYRTDPTYCHTNEDTCTKYQSIYYSCYVGCPEY